jgi:hypothetical protein
MMTEIIVNTKAIELLRQCSISGMPSGGRQLNGDEWAIKVDDEVLERLLNYRRSTRRSFSELIIEMAEHYLKMAKHYEETATWDQKLN